MCTNHLVLSEAALLLLLVVDSESELERGRRDSLLYTRKLSVTGWFPPSKPLLGKPEEKEKNKRERERECEVSVCDAKTVGQSLLLIFPLYLGAGRHCHCHCRSWSWCGGCGASSSAWLLTAGAAEGGRWGFGSPPPQRSQRPGSWAGALAFWGVQPFFGSSWRRGQMSVGPPLEPRPTRTRSDLEREMGL